MLEDPTQATALSPLDWIACASCRADSTSSSLNPGDFFLSTCGHVLCHACISASTSQHAQGDARTCPACGTTGPIVRLDEASDLQHVFRPLGNLVGELSMAAEWQIGNLVEQLRFFKAKCGEQKKMLARAGTELKRVKGIKAQAEQLAAENALLKNRLAQAQNQAQGQRFPSAQEYNAQGRAPTAPFVRPASSRGQKRKADFSTDRSDLPLRPATHLSNLSHPHAQPLPSHSYAQNPQPPRSASSASHSLPSGPQRLSLTPRSQREASEKLRRRVGEAGASGSGGSGGAESAREKLARFAYNPNASVSRASHRPHSTLPHAEPGLHDVDVGDGPSPFRFNPPGPSESEREEMPPPPVPHAHAHGHGRVGGSDAAGGGQGGWRLAGEGEGGRVGTPFAHNVPRSSSARPSPFPHRTDLPPRFSHSHSSSIPGTLRPFVPSGSRGATGAGAGRAGAARFG